MKCDDVCSKVAVSCRVLPCVAVCCSVLQRGERVPCLQNKSTVGTDDPSQCLCCVLAVSLQCLAHPVALRHSLPRP